MSELAPNLEIFQSIPKVDLTKPYENVNFPPQISIDASLLGANKWSEMMKTNLVNKNEKIVIVSTNGKKIFTSRVFEEEATSDKKSSISTEPLGHTLPQLLLLTNRVDIVKVHTHPPLPEEYCEPNNINSFFSYGDIFIFSKHKEYNGIVMLEKNGVHLLIGRHPQHEENFFENIENEGINKAKDNGKITLEKTVKYIAGELNKEGIGYYYRKGTGFNNQEKNIVFTNVLNYKK